MKKIRVLSVLLVIIFLLGSAAAAGAVLSTQGLSVNGQTVNCEKYNIDGSNYFKLRDIAFLLNGTASQFSVGWDASTQTISIVRGQIYVPNGTELDLSGGDKSATAKPSQQTIQINGQPVSGLSVYNVGGNNYFKLRDLGDALGFSVGYNETTRTATVASHSAAGGVETTPIPSTTVPQGNTVYKTPTGKRYHYDLDCAGVNGTPTTVADATRMGLTPCKKCAGG